MIVNLHRSTPNGKPIRMKQIPHSTNKWKSGPVYLQKMFLPVSIHYCTWISIKTHRTDSFLVSYFLFYFFKSLSLTPYRISVTHCPVTQLSFFSFLMLLKTLYLSYFSHFCTAISLKFIFLSLMCLSLNFPPLTVLEFLSVYCHIMPYSFSVLLLWPFCSHISHHTMLSTP